MTASGTLFVGQTDYPLIHGNRIITAGGKITAATINVYSTNGVGAVLGNYAPIPIEATTSASFGTGTYVYPELAEGCKDPIGGVIFTAPNITGHEYVKLDPAADENMWRLVPTQTTISLWRRSNTTVVIVR